MLEVKEVLKAVPTETEQLLDLFSEFATDEGAENNGTWVPYGRARFLIGRVGNDQYGKAISNEVEENKVELDREDTAAEALSKLLMNRVLAKTVLLGWEGVSFKGSPLAYSEAEALKMLGMKDFRRKVLTWANDINLFKAKQEAEQTKN